MATRRTHPDLGAQIEERLGVLPMGVLREVSVSRGRRRAMVAGGRWRAVPGKGVIATSGPTTGEAAWREALMAVGNSGSHVQLLAPLTPESTIARFLDRSGPGVQQVAYRVDDIEAVSATLRERGLRLLYDEPKRGTSDSRVNFIHPKDAGGILVELVQPAPTPH